MLFSKLYYVYSKSIFYSNDLVYLVKIPHTNLKQDTEQRVNKQKSKTVNWVNFR
jgi:hypothetical protein